MSLMLAQMAGSDGNSLLCLSDYKLRPKANIHIMRLICENILVYCRRRYTEAEGNCTTAIVDAIFPPCYSYLITYFLDYSRAVV